MTNIDRVDAILKESVKLSPGKLSVTEFLEDFGDKDEHGYIQVIETIRNAELASVFPHNWIVANNLKF